MQAALGSDKTTYSFDNLKGVVNSKRREGEHIRSFQLLAHRLNASPKLANILVHKPGPLSDYSSGEVAEYAAVLSRGTKEVSDLISAAKVRAL